MFRVTVFIATCLILSNCSVSAQTINFKKYFDSSHGFYFDIPSYWTIKFSKEQDGVICIPTTKAQKDIFKDCFEGIVFRMDFFDFGLDSTLSDQGYSKVGDTYYTSDRVNDSVKTETIKGKNWTGIYHDNVCGISCTDNGFHAAAGECQFLFFSNGKTTVCINTNGRAFENIVLKRIINSFGFTNNWRSTNAQQ
jgi:hypothetical protein